MAGGLGTSLVGQEEAASGKPLGQGERERKKGLGDGSGAR